MELRLGGRGRYFTRKRKGQESKTDSQSRTARGISSRRYAIYVRASFTHAQNRGSFAFSVLRCIMDGTTGRIDSLRETTG